MSIEIRESNFHFTGGHRESCLYFEVPEKHVLFVIRPQQLGRCSQYAVVRVADYRVDHFAESESIYVNGFEVVEKRPYDDEGKVHAKQAALELALAERDGSPVVQRCRVCGCTDMDCRVCVEAQGFPCTWADENLCSRCAADEEEDRSYGTSRIAAVVLMLLTAAVSGCTLKDARKKPEGKYLITLPEQTYYVDSVAETDSGLIYGDGIFFPSTAKIDTIGGEEGFE